MPVPFSRLRPYRPQVVELEGRLLPSTFLVTTADDAGPGSLRQAILDSDGTPGLNTIAFNIGGGGVQTIRPTSALPQITNPVVIDGTTQPGYAGTPLIELAGPGANSTIDGLTITAGNSAVHGLAIHDFRYGLNLGLYLSNNGGNLITGDYIGTDPSGEVAEPNFRGVYLEDSPDNTIGGTAPGQGNVISGNLDDGIDAASVGLVVQGNYLGTDATGTLALGNGRSGLTIEAAGFTGALIGGTDPGAGNLISGNHMMGLDLAGFDSLVEGNLIGTDVTGTVPLGNGVGVWLDISGDGHNTVGGTAPGAGNVISGNGFGIGGVESPENVIQGNLIGTDVSGTVALGNGVGIDLGQAGNLVGGTDPGAGNVISGNFGDGIQVQGSNNQIQGNRIGTDASGTRPLGNGRKGIDLYYEGVNNTIGGTAPGAGNVISANGDDGIYSELTGTLIQGNFIGVDVSGVNPLGNAANGVHLRGFAARNTVGGTAPGAGNIIAYSGHDGVLVDFVSRDPILGNTIYASGNLGIELIDNGNNNQAAPALDTAVVDADSITITGTLQSAPDTAYTLEFFGNDVRNPSGYGEGQRFLGSSTVTTDDNGLAVFALTLPLAGVDPGQYVSATATDPVNNTSAFSACVSVTRPLPQAEPLGMAVPVTGTAEPPPDTPTAPDAPPPAPALLLPAMDAPPRSAPNVPVSPPASPASDGWGEPAGAVSLVSPFSAFGDDLGR